MTEPTMPEPVLSQVAAAPVKTRVLCRVVHTCAAMALLLIFAMAITGWMSATLSSNPFTVSDDELWNSLNDWRGLILGFHRWGGIGLLLAVLGAGIATLQLGRKSTASDARMIRLLGWVVLIVAPAAVLFSHGSGVVAGPLLFETLPDVDAMSRVDDSLPLVGFRDATAQAAYELHMGFGLILLGAASVALVAASVVASAVAKRDAEEE